MLQLYIKQCLFPLNKFAQQTLFLFFQVVFRMICFMKYFCRWTFMHIDMMKWQENENISENWMTKQVFAFIQLSCSGAWLQAVHFFPYLAIKLSLVMQIILTCNVFVLLMTSNKWNTILPLSGNWLSWLQTQWHIVCPQIILFKVSCNGTNISTN